MQEVITAINIERAKRLYVDQGLTAAETARRVDVTQKTLGRWVKAFKWRNNFKRMLKPELIKVAAKMYITEGLTAAEISRMIDVTPKTLGEWVKKYEWKQARVIAQNNQMATEDRQTATRPVIQGFIDYLSTTAPFLKNKVQSHLNEYINQLK